MATNFILGTGIMPAAGAVADQLTATTRRGVIPLVVDNYSKAHPFLAMLVANANMAAGGVSSITQPGKFGSAVAVQPSDYSGKFNLPSDNPVVSDAEWNLKLAITPIQMGGVEMLIQDEHAFVDLVASRFDDVGPAMADYDSLALYGNVTDTTQILGLPAAIDDGTNLVNYAGISRTTQPKWKAYFRTVTAGTYPTRANVIQYIIGVTKNAGGEMPRAIFCGLATWAALQQDFQGMEIINRNPGNLGSRDDATSGFVALSIAGVPIFMDPYCAEGDMWHINDRYLNLYFHQNLAFAMSPFESLMSNGQFAYLSAILTMRELVCSKPAAQGHISGYSSLSL